MLNLEEKAKAVRPKVTWKRTTEKEDRVSRNGGETEEWTGKSSMSGYYDPYLTRRGTRWNR